MKVGDCVHVVQDTDGIDPGEFGKVVAIEGPNVPWPIEVVFRGDLYIFEPAELRLCE